MLTKEKRNEKDKFMGICTAEDWKAEGGEQGMNLQEAIEYLQPIADSTPMRNYSEALKKVMDAAKKQIPLPAVKRLGVDFFGSKKGDCPTCNIFLEKRYKNCPFCGQSLTWPPQMHLKDFGI